MLSMKKLATLAALALTALTACSGHGSNALPLTSPQAHGNTTTVPKSTIAAPAGWSATNTQAITNILNATDLGALTPGQSLTVRVALQMQNMAQLQSLIASGQTIDQGTFMATYAPTSTQVAAVTQYLQSQGLTNIQTEPNNLLISATGTASQIASAFNTKLEAYSVNGLASYANTQPAFVPNNLAGTVVAVLGLNNLPAAKPQPQKNTNTSTSVGGASQTVTPCTANTSTTTGTNACPRFYDPYTFQTTYDALGMPPASKTSIAIMTEGDLTTSINDFRTNESKFGLPQAPITIVPVGLHSTDTAGSDEWTLDMTYTTGIAQQVQNLYLYNFTSLSDSDIVLGFNRWATDNKAPIANSSFGGCELFSYLDGSMLVADMIFAQAAAQGQTMFVSTGDTGSFCSVGAPPNGVPGGAPLAEWPAVSPYVTAVGGTDLFSNPNGSYLGEDAWEAGGGGVSQFEYSPYWESGVQPATNAGSFRGVPDVAMDASLETGALLYLGGTEYITGGTSLASPLAAGSYARFQSAHANHLGFGPVNFYRIYNNNPTASSTSVGPPPTEMIGGFHDILSGANGLYTALPRYDYTTGLGSFDVTRTNAVIK